VDVVDVGSLMTSTVSRKSANPYNSKQC